MCDTLGPLDCRIHPDAPLRGEIEVGTLGAVRVANVRTETPHSVHRTKGLIRRDVPSQLITRLKSGDQLGVGQPEQYRLVLPIAGSHYVAQDERVTLLTPGDFTIYDFSRPYDVGYESAVQLAIFGFPRSLLPGDADAMSSLTATAIPATAARLSTVLLDLIATALTERLGRSGSAPESQRTLLFRVHTFIEQHLPDADLTPRTIAAVHHISLRNLHRLFAAEQTTVGGWIRQRRLERCRKDLADPGLGSRPVSAIAARWGLADSAYFSRLFRSTYGMPPSDYRRACFDPVATGQGVGTLVHDLSVCQ